MTFWSHVVTFVSSIYSKLLHIFVFIFYFLVCLLVHFFGVIFWVVLCLLAWHDVKQLRCCLLQEITFWGGREGRVDSTDHYVFSLYMLLLFYCLSLHIALMVALFLWRSDVCGCVWHMEKMGWIVRWELTAICSWNHQWLWNVVTLPTCSRESHSVSHNLWSGWSGFQRDLFATEYLESTKTSHTDSYFWSVLVGCNIAVACVWC